MHGHLSDYVNTTPLPTGPTITGPIAALVLRGELTFAQAVALIDSKVSVLIVGSGIVQYGKVAEIICVK